MNIIRGTTPTIVYKFKTVKPAEITDAILTMKRDGVVVFERDMSGVVVGEDTLSWPLTQEDTLGLPAEVSVMINWITDGGIRGASRKTTLIIESNYHPEVMTW